MDLGVYGFVVVVGAAKQDLNMDGVSGGIHFDDGSGGRVTVFSAVERL